MKTRQKRNITIGILCCMLVFMGIGYAALQQVLTINATGNITGAWKIYINQISVNKTSVTDDENLTEMQNGTYVDATDNTKGYFLSSLKQPGDYVTYDVIVKNEGSIKGVLDSVELTNTPDIDFQNYLNSIGKDYSYFYSIEENIEEGVTLEAGEEITYQITVRYKETAEMIPVGSLKTEIKLAYTQEGAGTNTPGGGSGSTVDPNTSPITVDSNGLVTGYNKEALTDDNGYVVIPATTAEGEKVVSIDSASFAEYNAALTYIYDEETDEESTVAVVYDEENYDEMEAFITALLNGEVDGSGSESGSGSYSSSSSVLGKDINPTNLIGKTRKNKLIEKLSGSTSGSGSGSSGAPTAIYRASSEEFKALIEGKIVEYEYYYMVPSEGIVAEPSSQIEKLDLTQAVHLKKIEESAFAYSPLQEIKLGNTIEEIGDYAFEETGLTSIVLPSSLKRIGESAFSYNSINESIIIPNGVTEIGDYAFNGNQISGTLVIPDSVTSLGYSAFQSNKLSRVEIGNSLITIQSYTFANNQLTEGIKLSNSIISIGSYAFQSAQIGGSLTIPENLTNLGENAFYGNSITELTIPENLTNLGENAFYGNSITELTIPENITSIGSSAFAGNQISNLVIEKCSSNVCMQNVFGMASDSSVTINSGEIGNYAFQNSNISTLTLGDEVTSIGYSAFSGNQISGRLVISENITSIGSSAFAGNQINDLVIEKCSSSICTSYAFGMAQNSSVTINSGEIGASAFQNSNISTLILGDDVTSIGNNSFYNNSITELTIPSNITTIGSAAFRANKITELTIPSSVTSVGTSAFYENPIANLTIENCTINTCDNSSTMYGLAEGATVALNAGVVEDFSNSEISKLILGENVTQLGSNAFRNASISELVIENCTTDICKQYMFGLVDGASITINSGDINYNAFYNEKISKLTLGAGVKTIGTSAFENNQISELILPNSITSIGLSAFANNQISGTLIIPASITRLSGFKNNSITSLVFEDSDTNPSQLKDIHSEAFSGNQISGTLTLVDSIETLGWNAFYGNQITELTIPNSVTTIEESAFSNNQISGILTLPNSLEIIGTTAFVANQISGEITIPASVTTIGQNGFNSNMIETLNFDTNSKLTTIGMGAFGNNQISGEITIPASVTALVSAGWYTSGTFYNNKITKLTFENTEERPSQLTTIGAYVFYENQIEGELVIPSSVTTIGNNAFEYNQIETLTFESGSKLTKIEAGAFADNEISGTLIIPSSVTTIGNGAFMSNRISTLIFEDTENNPSQLTTIGANPFYNNNNRLTNNVVIPSSVTTIGDSAFASNSALPKIIIKREDSTGMALGNNWNGTAEVIYDPNYEG